MSFFDDIGDAVSDAAGAVGDAVTDVTADVAGAVNDAGYAVGSSLDDAAGAVGSVLGDAAEAVDDGVRDVAGDDWLMHFADAGWDVATMGEGYLGAAVGDAFGSAADAVTGFAENLM